MSARPQFSLRMLFFVTMMICLAATTARFSPSEPDSMQHFAVRLQAYIRLVACLLFPAIFTAGAIAKSGSSRAFCLGAILPASMPMLMVCFFMTGRQQLLFGEKTSSFLRELTFLSSYEGQRITTLWLCAAMAGMCAVFFRWFLPTGETGSAEARQDLVVRVSLVVLLLAFASAAMIALPDSSSPSPGVGVSRQAPIRLTLCSIFPALFAVGAVEGRGNGRSFCACALIPALAPVLLTHSSVSLAGHVSGLWEPSLLYQWRYSIVAMWMLAPLFGGACLFFHWFFQRDQTSTNAE